MLLQQFALRLEALLLAHNPESTRALPLRYNHTDKIFHRDILKWNENVTDLKEKKAKGFPLHYCLGQNWREVGNKEKKDQ